jgi:cell division protein FtsI (penicillin-binding protein 3)
MGVVPVHKALEESSDVAAVKLALRVGSERFSQYIRDFGFGARTGAELPGETRGLLQPVKKWGPSSIGSIAIGQEVGVTPIQLVSMVSTIANGGIYLPPHVLMPVQMDSGNNQGSAASPLPSPIKPGEELPNPLPPGAHRVITELTAAQMRKMMEGVVLFGTGRPAQLNGFSSGGKTGTAQKINPETHTYSKTMHIASFAGIAPVNNPVISVAVVIDDPKNGSYYGTAVSAPVFAEVAQQVLEYLGVPHDTDVLPPKAVAAIRAPITEDDVERPAANIDALFAAANDLPGDDPLRAGLTQAQFAAPSRPANSAADPEAPATGAQSTKSRPQTAASPPANREPNSTTQPHALAVMVSDSGKLQVPSLVGLPVRKVIELAAAAGLEVQVAGFGTAREQAPAAGTMVTPGTQVVVRCEQ